MGACAGQGRHDAPPCRLKRLKRGPISVRPAAGGLGEWGCGGFPAGRPGREGLEGGSGRDDENSYRLPRESLVLCFRSAPELAYLAPRGAEMSFPSVFEQN
jgi:hypothetical protein